MESTLSGVSGAPANVTTSFESSLKEIEKIVAEMERGELPLENQLKQFERGVALSRECLKKLDEVERAVETLTTNGDGKLSTQPFDAGA